VSSPAKKRTIDTAAEAEHAIENLNLIMNRLIETIEEETAYIRKGRLRDALALEPQKHDLSLRYAAESGRVQAAQKTIAASLPQALEALRQRHAAFQAVLQTNLTVIATAHAVSEGIIRGVSGELARRQVPSTYGVSGRANAPGPRTAPPIAISRTL
jgi:hypothetical protein